MSIAFSTYATDATTASPIRGVPNAISPGSDGNNWTQISGNQTASYVSNQIVLTYGSNSNLGVWTYAGQSQADQEVLVNITQGNSTSAVAGAVLRCVDANHFYYADLGNSSGNIEIGKYISGTFTQLASAPFASAAGTKYGLRFQVVGQTLRVRVWDASTTEPMNWSAQATDIVLFTGGFGICTAPTGTHSCFYDTFSATNGVYISSTPIDPTVGVEQVGLIATGANADLVPAQDISAYNMWSLHINTIATGGTITFQGSNDNVNWVSAYGYSAVDKTTASSATATGLWAGPRLYRYFRARQTVWTSGASAATLELYYRGIV
jgi:hypothetical protein